MNSKHLIAAFALGACAMCVTAQRASATLLIDRGLPTINLNNAAGSDRSNVSWSDGGGDGTYWLVGDDFTNTSSLTYNITDIRVWTTGHSLTDPTLFGGLAGTDLNVVSIGSASVDFNATYADGSTYQLPNNNYIPIQQIDFTVNIALGAGQTYDFFPNASSTYGENFIFVAASNAALSGSHQNGADNYIRDGLVSSGTISADSIDFFNTDAPGVWDKSSDINVQVFGTVPDAASTLSLLGLAFSSLLLLRRKIS